MKRYIDSYCRYLEKQKVISPEQFPVYTYGLELMTFSILNIMIVVGLSVVLNQGVSVFFFLLGFIPMRLFAGGFHAENHLNCSIVFAGIYVCSILVHSVVHSTVLGGLLLAEAALIYLLAPVESPNKQITDKRRALNRKKSAVIVLLNFIVFVFYMLFWRESYFISWYLVGGVIASATLPFGKFKLHCKMRN